MRKFIIMVPAFLLMVGCGTTTFNAKYVQADRSTYNAISPEYTRYLEGDDSLDDAAKARRFRTIESWKRRIESAEETLKKGDDK